MKTKNIFIKTLIAITIINTISPIATVKAAETQYIDVFIPRDVRHEYVRGDMVYYDPDGKLKQIQDLNSSFANAKYQTEVDTDFPYAQNYFWYDKNGNMKFDSNETRYTSLADLEANETNCRYSISVELWNIISKADFRNNKYSGYYYNFYYPKKTYFYDQYTDHSANNNYDEYHSFLSRYDYFIIHDPKSQYQACRGVKDHFDYTEDYIVLPGDDGQVQPLEDSTVIKYIDPYKLSEPYTGTPKYQTDDIYGQLVLSTTNTNANSNNETNTSTESQTTSTESQTTPTESQTTPTVTAPATTNTNTNTTNTNTDTNNTNTDTSKNDTKTANTNTTTAQTKESKTVKSQFSTDKYKNKYYYDKNGKKVTGFKKIGKKYYYFSTKANKKLHAKKGYMVTETIKTYKGHKYYFGKDGKAITKKWKTMNGKKYYFNEKGQAVTGKVKINGKTYKFDKSGKLVKKYK